jgi:hypothetical protein
MNELKEANELNEAGMRRGLIQSFNAVHKCGTIVSGWERFFYHTDRVIYGPTEPEIGSAVFFEVSPAKPKPGKLAVAIRISIVDNKCGSQALAGTTDDGQNGVKAGE